MAQIGSSFALGKMIRIARKRAGLTQLALASEMGLGPQFISSIERGVRPIPRRHIDAISNALRLNRSEIIDAMVEIEKTRISGGDGK